MNLYNIQKTIKQDAISKFNGLNTKYDLICEIIPGHLHITNDRQYFTKIFYCSEDEKHSTLEYIEQYLNELNITYNNVAFMAFSQMEATLHQIIKNMGQLKAYKQYLKSLSESNTSSFREMLNFIIELKDYTPSPTVSKIFSVIDGKLREQRNIFAHKLYKNVSVNNVYEVIGDGINVEYKLWIIHCTYTDGVNQILDIVDYFLWICNYYFT